MDEQIDRSQNKLVINLQEMIKLYRQLLEVVRKEKEILVSAKLDDLTENNVLKDQILGKIRLVETLRFKHAQELAVMLKADADQPRLLDLAQRLPTSAGDRLRSQHATLDLLVKRLVDLNRDNENLAQSALKTLGGAMSEIKETLSGKKTYEKKGQYKLGPDQSGNFVSREA